MGQRGKIRVALDDCFDAIQLVRAAVCDATGLSFEVDFQEIERRGELVVELGLDDTGGYTPTELVKMVASGARHLEVLSAWTEPVVPVEDQPIRCLVVDLLQCEIPDLALRAHRDGVATARWHPASPTQVPHWLLAVPGIDADRRAIVGIRRRTGYYYRFSASEASRFDLQPALTRTFGPRFRASGADN